MKSKVFMGIELIVLLLGMFSLAFNIQPAKASGTIYIRADGSVEPITAPISSVDNVTYTFTDNIFDQSIVVERDNIVIDGAGYTLQGSGSENGFDLSSRYNVTIENTKIDSFDTGILLVSSLGNTIAWNNIANDNDGIRLVDSSNNVIFENKITANNMQGIGLDSSSNNSISGNNITANNYEGIGLSYSSNNTIYHNNFIDNTQQVHFYDSSYANVWDDGYPSGGNYWSNSVDMDDYSGPYQNETGSDGIWDQPYVIDDNNTDNYPFTNPFIFDNEGPVVKNVMHVPLYPNSTDLIYFYADVTDNVGVALVQLNYTEDGGATWLLKDMPLLNGTTYSTSLGPYSQGEILGFYVVAWDTSGNVAFGSEIVPPIPEPPRVAPIVVSDEPSAPLPDGKDISYNVTETGTEVFVNVTEIGIYQPGKSYNISYSIDGGITWIIQPMAQIGSYVWKSLINATTNILFKIVVEDGSQESMVYWIIVGPWKYPIYLYFSENEQYFPVRGLDFDGDNNVTNNWISYQNNWEVFKQQLLQNDEDDDGVPDVWSYTYMNPKTLDDGCLVIEYWIYYAFNRYPILGEVIRDDHEHDFESVYLWVDVATGDIKKMALSQHSWVNHYTFSSPPEQLNIAVEEGGHGMVLLSDSDNGGLPEDYDSTPGYDIWQPEGGGTIIRGTWTEQSVVASLYPWVIFDTRIPQSQLHLFGDSSILTTGLSLEIVSPLLPSIVDKTPSYYGWLTDYLGSRIVLQTSFGAPLLFEKMLVFQVTAPWYRQEFQHPAEMWGKVPWVVYSSKIFIYHALPFITAGLTHYFKIAAIKGIIIGWVANSLTKYVIKAFFDPVAGYVADDLGRVLGYIDGELANDIPGGLIFATRSLTNDHYDLFFIFTNSTEGYTYYVRGQDAETYNMTLSLTDADGIEIVFEAVEIPTLNQSIHKYLINWDSLGEEDSGVEVWVDQNGDGAFEQNFWSDAELTGSEFEEETVDETPPFTSHDYDDLWHTEDFTIHLTATDDPSGVAETFYKINDGPIQNVSAHGQPAITDESANNTLEYWSIDNIGNEELPHKILSEIKLDKTSPTIGTPSRIPGGDVQPDQDVRVLVNATDSASGVSNVTLSYNLNYGTIWIDLPMTLNSTTGLFEVTVPGQEAGTFVKYSIRAYDNAGNLEVEDNSGQYYVYAVIPEFPSFLILPLFMITTLLAVIVYGRKHSM